MASLGSNTDISFDTQRLEDLLRSHLPTRSRVFDIQPVDGGQSNPTYFVTLGHRRLVLRKRPSGPLLPSAHAVDREFRIQLSLRNSAVPVPEVLLYCDDETVVGTAFYVMERVPGRIFHNSALPGVSKEDRSSMYAQVAAALGALHRLDPAAMGLSDFGRPGNYFARQISRWTRQWQMSRVHELPEIEQLIAWLSVHIPEDERVGIIHGDFRMGNLIFDPVHPRIVAILDWELATLGHPLADLAHTCLYSWFLGSDEYGGGLMGLDAGQLGIPSLHQFVNRYRGAAGIELQLEPFHVAFSLFRNAMIFEGIAARARAGNASADNARDIGELAPTFARRALEVIAGQHPI